MATNFIGSGSNKGNSSSQTKSNTDISNSELDTKQTVTAMPANIKGADSDGSVTINLPDSQGGGTKVIAANGTITVTQNGNVTTTYPNGTVTILSADGIFTLTAPDGNVTIKSADGTITHTDADGNVTNITIDADGNPLASEYQSIIDNINAMETAAGGDAGGDQHGGNGFMHDPEYANQLVDAGYDTLGLGGINQVAYNFYTEVQQISPLEVIVPIEVDSGQGVVYEAYLNNANSTGTKAGQIAPVGTPNEVDSGIITITGAPKFIDITGSSSIGNLTFNVVDTPTGAEIHWTYTLTDNSEDHSDITSTGTSEGVSELFTVTVTDFNGTTSTSNLEILVLDDGPIENVEALKAADVFLVDETALNDADPSNSKVTHDFKDNFSDAIIMGADDPGTIDYALVLKGSNIGSGLYAVDATDTSATDGDGIGQGDEIVLNQSSNVITGSINGTDYFTITLNGSEVTFEQLNSIWHDKAGIGGGNPDLHDEALSLNLTDPETLQITAVATDADGDVSNVLTLALGGNVFTIEDDGPVVNAPTALSEVNSADLADDKMIVDESAGQQLDPADNVSDRQSSANFNEYFSNVTVNGIGGTSSYGTDGAGSVAFALNITGTNGSSVNGLGSGIYALDSADTESVIDGIGQGAEILLFDNNGVIEGRVGSSTGDLYFTISNTNSEITLTQSGLNIWHDNTSSNDETVSLNGLGGDGSTTYNINLVQTIVDADGDSASSSLNLTDGGGANDNEYVFNFKDDGPVAISADIITKGADNSFDDVRLTVDESEGAQTNPADNFLDGSGDEVDRKSEADFDAYFIHTPPVDADPSSSIYGTDGPGNTDYSLSITSLNGDIVSDGLASGLYALDASDQSTVDGDGLGQGEEILLFINSTTGDVEGRTGSSVGDLYFTIENDGSNVVLIQDATNNIWHPDIGDNNDFVSLDGKGGTAQSSSNLLINGTFDTSDNNSSSGSGETGEIDHGSWSTFTAIDGWYASDGRIEVQTGPHGGTPNTNSNNNYIELDSHDIANTNSSISQNFTSECSSFHLSFDFSGRGNLENTSEFKVFIDGVEIAEFDPAKGWQQADINIDLEAGDHVLTFQGLGIEDQIGALIDNVELIDLDSSSSSDITYNINLIKTVTDADGDSESAALNLTQELGEHGCDGYIFNFGDDGPSVTGDLSFGVVTQSAFDDIQLSVDESPDSQANPEDNASTVANDRISTSDFTNYFSASAINTAGDLAINFGTDGPGGLDASSVVLGLTSVSGGIGAGVNTGLFGLVETAPNSGAFTKGSEIKLFLTGGGDVEGRADGNVYFTISNSGADVTLTQSIDFNMWHPDDNNSDDVVSLDGAPDVNGNATYSINLTANVEDADGDSAEASLSLTQSVDVSGSPAYIFNFGDDGPSIGAAGTFSATAVLDESPLPADGDDGVYSATMDLSSVFGAGSYGTDGEGSTSYAVSFDNSAGAGSGLYILDNTQTDGKGASIDLVDQGNGTVKGIVNGTSTEVFTISVDANSLVTFEYSDQTDPANIWHGNAGDNSNNEFDDSEAIQTAANKLIVTKSVTDADGDTATQTIDVGQSALQIQDDGPVAYNDHICTDGTQTNNVVLVIDRSGSMGWDSGVNDPNNSGNYTRMEVLQDSIEQLLNSYEGLGVLNVQIVSFAGDSSYHGWFSADVNKTATENAMDIISNLTPNSSTDYDDALQLTIDSYTNNSPPSAADNTTLYFLSDGNPNTDANKQATLDFESTWESFLNNAGSDITNSYAVGMGSGIPTTEYLDVVSYGNEDTISDPSDPRFRGEDNTIIVENFSDLSFALNSTIQDATGNVLDGSLSASGMADNYGTDEAGQLISFEHDGTTYNSNGSSTTITTADGGTFKFYFEDVGVKSAGDFEYTASTGPGSDITETFTYTIQDSDGDTASADLEICVDHEGVPVALTVPTIVLDEDDLPLIGNNDVAAGDDLPVNSSVLASGTLTPNYGDDGVGSLQLVAANAPSGFSYQISNGGLLLTIMEGSTAVATVTLTENSASPGEYNYEAELLAPITHQKSEMEDNIDFIMGLKVIDSNGDSVTKDFTLSIDDDLPTLTGESITGVVEEEQLAGGNEDTTDVKGLDTDETTTKVTDEVKGSLASLVSAGADGYGGFSFDITDPVAFIQGLGLSSNGVAINDATLSNSVFTAKAAANEIFSLEVKTNGDYTFTLIEQLDHHPINLADNVEDILSIDFSDVIKFTDGDGDSVKLDGDMFQIKVIDDIPIAHDDYISAGGASSETLNLSFILDVSGSMESTQSGGQTLMTIMKNSMISVMNKYEGQDVNITLVPFAGNNSGGQSDPVTSVNLGTFNMSIGSEYNEALSLINALKVGEPIVGRYTNYENVLDIAETVIANSLSAGVEQTLYFLSDGEPNRGDTNVVNWISYRESIDIDIIPVAIGGFNTSSLQLVGNIPGDVIEVTDPSQLEAVLLDNTPIAASAMGNVLDGLDGSGNNISIDGPDADLLPDGSDTFGADGKGGIISFEHDGTTYNSNGSSTTITTADGGTFKFYFEDLGVKSAGDFEYTASTGIGADVDEIFTYTIQDADGDHASATLTIGVDHENAVPSISIEKYIKVIESSSDPVDVPCNKDAVEVANEFNELNTFTFKYTADATDVLADDLQIKVKKDGSLDQKASLNVHEANLLAADQEVYIVVTDKKGNVIFEDVVAKDAEFSFDKAGNGSTAKIYIYDDANKTTLLESSEYHISCSAPIKLGDQLGALTLTSVADKGGDLLTLPLNVTLLESDLELGSPLVAADSALDYVIDVSNTGNVALYNVDITDSLNNGVDVLTRGSQISGNNDSSFDVGETWFYSNIANSISLSVSRVSDEIGNDDNILGVAEVWRYEVDGDYAEVGTNYNLGSVTATYDNVTVDATDLAYYKGIADPIFIVGQNIDDIGIDTPNSLLDDYVVKDNAITTSGTIEGSEYSHDVLVGDVGGVSADGKDSNIILILDTSGSMGNDISFNGQSMTRLEALQLSVKNMLTKLSQSGADNIRVHIIEYNTNSPEGKTYDLISNGVIDLSVLALAVSNINNFDEGGWTNYEAGLQRAVDWIEGNNTLADNGNLTNQAFFISDGQPNRALEESNNGNDFNKVESRSATEAMNEILGINPSGGDNGDNSNEVSYIEQNFGVIEAIGINVSNSNLDRLSQIDSNDASNITTGDELEQLLSDLNPLYTLSDAGDDTIKGGDGDDLIFGDVLNTDALALAHGITLPKGSGWEVFSQLENDSSNSWDRADTLEYVKDFHQSLAEESGRDGGNDYLEGGAGNDIIYGQEGNDVINAGTGVNHVDGGSGDNTFEFNINDLLSPGTITTIDNFDNGTGNNKLNFSDVFDINGDGATNETDLASYIKDVSVNANDETEIHFRDQANGNGDGGILILTGYQAGQAANDIADIAIAVNNVDV